MALTAKQSLYKCCGLYCAMLACVGVYFYLVMAYFQSSGNVFVIEMLEDNIDGSPSNTAYDESLWVNSFLITAAVSFSS